MIDYHQSLNTRDFSSAGWCRPLHVALRVSFYCPGHFLLQAFSRLHSLQPLNTSLSATAEARILRQSLNATNISSPPYSSGNRHATEPRRSFSFFRESFKIRHFGSIMAEYSAAAPDDIHTMLFSAEAVSFPHADVHQKMHAAFSFASSPRWPLYHRVEYSFPSFRLRRNAIARPACS